MDFSLELPLLSNVHQNVTNWFDLGPSTSGRCESKDLEIEMSSEIVSSEEDTMKSLFKGFLLCKFFEEKFDRIFFRFLDTEFAPFVEDRWRQLFDLEERSLESVSAFAYPKSEDSFDEYYCDNGYAWYLEDCVVDIDLSVLECPVEDTMVTPNEPSELQKDSGVTESSIEILDNVFRDIECFAEEIPIFEGFEKDSKVIEPASTSWADQASEAGSQHECLDEEFDVHKLDDEIVPLTKAIVPVPKFDVTKLPTFKHFETNQLHLVREITIDPFKGLLEHHESILARNDWTSLCMYLPMSKVPTCDDLLNAPTRHTEPEFIQSAIDEILPGVCDLDGRERFFQEIVETSDIALELEKVTIDASVVRDWTKRGAVLSSKFNTGAMSRRNPTFREAALAVKKRNLNVPDLKQVMFEDEEARKIANRFINTVLDPNKLAQFPGYISEGEKGYFEQYLVGKSIPEDAFIDPCALVSMDKYRHMIKTSLKPTEDNSIIFERPLPATITFHDKGKVMSTSPIFLMMANRLMLCLNDKITIPSGKYHQLYSIDPFSFEMTKEFKEIDFSKFDKSQQRLHHLIQYHVFKALGANTEFLDMWFGSHEISHIRDGLCGLGFSVAYQRRTGDACTYLGNTIITLAALAYLYDLLDPNVTFVVASGDDSLIGSLKPLDRSNEFLFTTLFNFEAKFPHNMPFVCSKFLCLVPTTSGGKKVVAVPNVLKLLIKLGIKDMNPFIFDAWYDSWLDLLWFFDNFFIVSEIRDYVSHRYLRRHTHFLEGAILALRTVFSSKTKCLKTLFDITPKELIAMIDSKGKKHDLASLPMSRRGRKERDR
uniref:RNA-directed RNA polymerase 2a n=1 Tax=Lilac leaf chlorosis virus TaxID=722755 RepID=A0A3S6H0E8_9BROM|nr:RNA-dependent RNA polymerase [Lilac leaf chlorosis virus]